MLNCQNVFKNRVKNKRGGGQLECGFDVKFH